MKLKKCPFCGEIPRLSGLFTPPWHEIICNCGVRMQQTLPWYSEEALVKLWNKRILPNKNQFKGAIRE